MSDYGGYRLEVLRSGDETTLYRARSSGQPPVLAVAVAGQRPSASRRLAHENALTFYLDPEWAARTLAFTRHRGADMLVLEDRGSVPLDILLRNAEPPTLARSMDIACSLADAVSRMHRDGVIHKDIKPANILVDEGGAVRLTGFGIATRVRSERQAAGPPEIIAGTLAYMAPEQTGRMNRSVDTRSDLYSLGVTFYELFTGELPFNAVDPMEWIHCHIARQPRAPTEVVAHIPWAIGAIILKLLSKNPEDRYQTARGLESDLRECRAAWNEQGEITGFTAGRNDMSDRLLMPEKLYGRDAEIKVLYAAAQRTLIEGASEMVLVSGYAGIGKSSIVNELHKVLVPPRGLFASGKFDQYKRDIPYATLAQAFQGLLRQLLSRSETELTHWNTELSQALGPNGQLMVDLIPELALVIGEQPPAPAVDPQTAQSRFHLVFRSFMRVFARAEHPLILFIDDLQWMDKGTLDLLEAVLTDPDMHHLMIIAAYRDNEVGPEHALHAMLAAIRRQRGAISEITLGPLLLSDMRQLCADALSTSPSRVQHLAELVFEKTEGNPFFAIQFVMALAEEELLKFSPDNNVWQWDVDRIRTKAITENVAHFMSVRLGRLGVNTQEALARLACLGNIAEEGIASLVLGCSREALRATLEPAIDAGLIVCSAGSYTFTHDRMQEASYALIPIAERPAIHMKIGRILLSLTSPSQVDETIFEIVSQFNRGRDAIVDPGDREHFAKLNLMAGKRAKNSSAYASAQTYFAAGRRFLGEDSWERYYGLTFDLELQTSECEIVSGDLAAAECRLSDLSRHATGITDQAGVVCLSVLLFFSTGRNEQAVRVALEYLSDVGIDWSLRPSHDEVRQEHLEMHRKLALTSMEELIDLPAMTDSTNLAIMSVLTELFPAAYAVDRYLLELVLLRMTNISLEHGHCDSSSVAYSALNMALGSEFADYATCFGLGQLACRLVDDHGANRYKARVYSCFAAFTMPWMKHLPLCRPMMESSFQMGREMGDMAFAAYNTRNLMTHLIFSGLPLPVVQKEVEGALAFAATLQLGMAPERFIGQLGLVQKLRGGSPTEHSADDEWANQNVDGNPGLAMMVCYHWVFRLQERLFADDIPAALEAAARVEDIRWAMRSSIELAEYEFYAALAIAAAVDRASHGERHAHLANLTKHYERIAVWAENCPENFANRKALVGAEIARLHGRHIEAQGLYETAVRSSRENGFVQNEALANERAGQYYADLNLGTISDAYLINARDGFERWGSTNKVKQLDTRYPFLRVRRATAVPVATIDGPVAQLDVEAVDKASQTLSSEMLLPSLLEKLMRLTVEHAGAEKGALILLHQDMPYIEARAASGPHGLDVFVGRAEVTQADLPQSALNYVLRTRDRLILDDAASDGLDTDDPYVARNRPRSVLCLPIFKEASVIGVLYLENNLTTRAFTADRVAVLDFLASQAAIWLENARLYSNLQRSEGWLREAQHLSSTGSFYWRVASDIVEFSDQMYRTYELDPSVPVTLDLIASRIHDDDRPLMEEMVDIARGPGTILDYLYRARMPDMSVKHLHLVAQGTRDKDNQLVYTGAIQDVTSRYRAEEALGKARSELAHVTRTTTLGVLTASIAHEVNQPLLGIVTNASTCLRMLAADPPNLEGARRTAERSMRDGHRAADVIKRLRALFGDKGTTTETVDLNEALREVFALSSSELQRSRVSLQTDLAADLPFVMGDRVQLQQVVLNLLLNASDAMSDVHDQPRKLIVKSERIEGDHVRVTVQDVGTGIPPDLLDKLFEAFYTTKNGGMGMGLSISRAIIESHRGRLWAKSNTGPGATFSFSIPPAAAGDAAGRGVSASPSTAVTHADPA